MSESTLSNWLKLRDLTLADAKKEFNIQAEHIHRSANYGSLSRLTEANNPDTMPGTLYFKNDRFVLAYISHPHISGEALQDDPLLENERVSNLRSRAGKRSQQRVFPAQGVAISVNLPDDTVDFVEIFAPMSLADYQKQFYTDPGKFVK